MAHARLPVPPDLSIPPSPGQLGLSVCGRESVAVVRVQMQRDEMDADADVLLADLRDMEWEELRPPLYLLSGLPRDNACTARGFFLTGNKPSRNTAPGNALAGERE
jgi:hypothetical protein